MRYPRPVHRGFQLRLCALIIVASSVTAAACSSSPEASGDTTLVIGVSGSSITLENHTGTSLVKGEISVIPQGIPRPYLMFLPHMSSGAKRTFALTMFRQSDGTLFRAGVAKGKSVRVTALDAAGKTYTREVPFN